MYERFYENESEMCVLHLATVELQEKVGELLVYRNCYDEKARKKTCSNKKRFTTSKALSQENRRRKSMFKLPTIASVALGFDKKPAAMVIIDRADSMNDNLIQAKILAEKESGCCHDSLSPTNGHIISRKNK